MNIEQDYIDRLSRVDNFKYSPISEVIQLSGEERIEVKLEIRKAD